MSLPMALIARNDAAKEETYRPTRLKHVGPGWPVLRNGLFGVHVCYVATKAEASKEAPPHG